MAEIADPSAEERGRRLNPRDEDHTRDPSPDRGETSESRGRKPRDNEVDHQREFSPKELRGENRGQYRNNDQRWSNGQGRGYSRGQGEYNYPRGNRNYQGNWRGQNNQQHWDQGQQQGWDQQNQQGWDRNDQRGGYRGRGGQGRDRDQYNQGRGQGRYQDRGQRDNREWRQENGEERRDGYGGGRRRDADPVVFLSKKLSFILRHGAEKMKFKLMPGGFLWVDEILGRDEYKDFTVENVKHVVETNDKQRFTLAEENGRLKIRANQGHSLEVDGLELTPITDPKEALDVIHGTYFQSWNVIKDQGLNKMSRNHIHFAAGEPGENGVISGMRSSCEVIIKLNMEKALKDGLKFFRSANNVILSPGDADGFIRPCYFEAAFKRYPRERLLFNDEIKDGPSIPGLSGDMAGKGKKKKNKHKNKEHIEGEEKVQREKCEQTEQEVNMEGAGAMFTEDSTSATGTETGKAGPQASEAVPDAWDGNTESDKANNAVNPTPEKVKDFTPIEDKDCCLSAVEYLKSAGGPVVVYCPLKGEEVKCVACVSKDRALKFNKKLLNEGELKEFLNTTTSSCVKIFTSIADTSNVLFNQFNIVLDGTNPYDNMVAYDYVKDMGLGSMDKLPSGFDPRDWGSLVVGPQLLERCQLALQAYDLLSSWTNPDKKFKKFLFEEVNKNIDPEKLKAEKEKRKGKGNPKPAAAEPSSSPENKGKSKKKKGKK